MISIKNQNNAKFGKRYSDKEKKVILSYYTENGFNETLTKFGISSNTLNNWINKLIISTSTSTPTSTPKKISEEIQITNNFAENLKIYGKVLSLSQIQALDFQLLLTAVNNYIRGYRTSYNNNKNDNTSETRNKYLRMLEEQKKLEALLLPKSTENLNKKIEQMIKEEEENI